MSNPHRCGYATNGHNLTCKERALPGLDYCSLHLDYPQTYCAVRYCTTPPVSVDAPVCKGHSDELDRSGLDFLTWAKERRNPQEEQIKKRLHPPQTSGIDWQIRRGDATSTSLPNNIEKDPEVNSLCEEYPYKTEGLPDGDKMHGSKWRGK